WLRGVVTGDFGPSRRVPDIGADLAGRLLVTLRLVLLAILLAVVLALVVGVVGAVRRYGFTDHLLTLIRVIFLSLPVFWFAGLIGLTVITEKIFAWHGMGSMLLDGIANRDVYVVLAWLLVAAAAVVIFNLIADLLYAVLDPRIRHG